MQECRVAGPWHALQARPLQGHENRLDDSESTTRLRQNSLGWNQCLQVRAIAAALTGPEFLAVLRSHNRVFFPYAN
jgi:hypothetical protein